VDFASGFLGSAPFQPACVAGVQSPANTSLKWGTDGELTAQDLHHVMARLCEQDPQAARALDRADG
jgi:hypothetical protein